MIPVWLEYTIFYGFWALLLALGGSIVLHLINEFHWLPPEAKALRKAKRKRLVPQVRFYDEGYADIVASEPIGEGVLVNPDGTFGVLASPVEKAELPSEEDLGRIIIAQFKELHGRSPNEEELKKIRKERKKQTEEVMEQIETMNAIATKKYILKGTGTPLLLQYAPLGISMSAGAVAITQHQQVRDKFHLDVSTVVRFFTDLWDNARLKLIALHYEAVGVKKERQRHNQLGQFLPVVIILALVLGIVAIIALL